MVPFTGLGAALIALALFGLLNLARTRFATPARTAHSPRAAVTAPCRVEPAPPGAELGGTGFRLAISPDLRASVTGEPPADSIDDKGRRARAALPSAKAANEPDADASKHAPAVSTRTLNILVADGDPISQPLTVALLEGAGHSVTLVSNGRKAVEAVSNGQYDLVLMDLQMPVMDGIRATIHIRALPPPKRDIPIIALTAVAPVETTERAPIDAYLSKPLSAAGTLRTIDALTTDGRPRSPSIDHLPVLDMSSIDMLREFMTPDQLVGLLAESHVDIEARIRRLGVCLDRANGTASAKEAHDLVSVAGNCGASALSALARDIERACKQDRLADAIQAFTRMRDVATAAMDAMMHLRETLAENAKDP